MKKMRMVLLTAALSAGTCMAAWAGAFDNYYDYENPDGTYSYYFSEGSFYPGIFVTMDKEWYQNTRIIVTDRGAAFYHTDSYDAYAEEGLDGGRLFTIGASVNSSFSQLPSYEYIGFDEESCMNFYAELPTDYQAYMGDETIRAEYDSLWAGVKDVIAKIRIRSAEEETGSQEPYPVSSTAQTPSAAEPSAVETPSTEMQSYVPDDVEPPTIITSGSYRYTVNADPGTITICDYIGGEEDLEVPSEIDGFRVTGIAAQAFSYGEIEHLILPDSIQIIAERAFEYCDITEVTIPAGVTVESCAFSYCDDLEKVIAGAGAVIRSRAFGYCDDLETVVLAPGSRLEKNAFEYCDELSRVILCGEVQVEEGACYGCDDVQYIHKDESELENWLQPERNNAPDVLGSLLTGGRGTGSEVPQTEVLQTEVLKEGEYRITLSGEADVITDCPSGAKAGETVTVHTVGVADGEVKIEVNGFDVGTWQDWGTYTFTMPDRDVEIEGWISTAGYPGA